MQPSILSCLVAALFAVDQGWHCAASWDGGDSVMSFLRHFNETRNTEVNPEAKQKARDFIISFFKESGLNTWTEEFPSNNAKYPGINVVGVLPGLHYRSYTDKIFIIGAHYDTVATTPGVDDNGSGIAAMLRAIKRYTMEDRTNCSRRDYTTMFVAFDLEEWQPSCSRNATVCGCDNIVCGSSNFVKNLTAFLNDTGSQLQGAVVMDTTMNYNTTPNSQNVPTPVEHGLPALYKNVKQNDFRGDFLAVIGREEDDGHLLRSFGEHYIATAEYKHIGIPLPFRGNPDDLPVQSQAVMSNFLRSDHKSFYRGNQKAIFLTDTANFRGYMTKCYHQACDTMSHVTSEMAGFLSKTADTLTSMAQDLTTNKDCGGLWNTTDEGYLTSKYYPCRYSNNLDCVWTIYKPAKYRGEDYKLALSFKDFLLEDSKNCSADFLKITEIDEGTGGSSPLTEYKFCGSSITKTIQTTKAGFRVHFHSNGFNTTKGFKASWTIEMPTSKAGVPRAQFLYLAVSILLMFLTTATATNL